jgi:hypothetical protein
MTTVADSPTVLYAGTVARAFELFQTVVNTDPDELKEARRRRDLVDTAFGDQSEVQEVFCSGSLARKTHKDPIHDVDSVVIFRTTAHPDWGIDGNGSAVRAVRYTADRVLALLGVHGGTVAQVVVSADPRNHAVRCDFGDLRGHGFTVDVMPALLFDPDSGELLVPVAREDRWERVDPRYFIRATQQRQADWDLYTPTVRVVKWWKDERKQANPALDAKSLLVEVCAFDHLKPAEDRPTALAQFFTTVTNQVARGYVPQDPARLCGAIQPDVNRAALLRELEHARDLATRALSQAARGDEAAAIETWRVLLGPSFPKPRPSVVAKFATPPVAATLPQQAPARPLRDEPQG